MQQNRAGLPAPRKQLVAAVAVVVAVLFGLPAVATAARTRDAEQSSSVTDASGLTVDRTWKIAADDPQTLIATIVLTNTNTAPVTTTIVEPIPTASLRRITFRPKHRLTAATADGLARIDVTVSSGSRRALGYTARLTRDREANAQDRMAAVQDEMTATMATAAPTDADRAVAAIRERYVGTLQVEEETSSNVDMDHSSVGDRTTVSVRLTTTPYCRVVARGCALPAQDSIVIEPRLVKLDPFGTSLVASGSADLADSGLTCNGASEPGLLVRSWSLEPRGWRLGWEGWQVSQAQYTLVEDLSSPANSRCLGASIHMLTTGLLTG